jgi:DNA helicase IV
VALLDEAAELLGTGEAESGEAAAEAAERAQQVEYAGRVLDMISDMEPDARQMTTADQLAGRYEATVSRRALVDEAASDRNWAFGHLVIDEAQELSAMQWRLLMRRCPSRSMTVVGDPAQTGSPAGARSWGQMLDRYVGGRWRLAELTVNYRTPEQIMDVAAGVVHAAGLDVTVPTSARVGRDRPSFTRVDSTRSAEVGDVVRSEWEQARPGTVVVITSRGAHADVVSVVTAALPSGVVTADTDALGSPVSVLTVADAKGLEFDTVVLMEPSEIVAESPRGINDLYVALTRPTQRLHVVSAGDLPPGMA